MASGTNNKLNILILSASNPYKNAGVVALDIYKGLKEMKDNDVRMVIKDYDNYVNEDINSIETYFTSTKKKVERKLHKILIALKIIKNKTKRTNPNYYMQDYNETNTYYLSKKILNKAGFKPDIIIVLFMQNFLTFKNLYELNSYTGAPIFLYLMDMAAITGGCHYAWDCIGYTKVCGNCPGLYSKDKNDQTHLNWKLKKEYIDKTNVIPIAATEWQFRQLQKSSLFIDEEKYKILLSINEEMFKPTHKKDVRKQLDFPLDKKIVFFGATNVNIRRKGFNELIESLQTLKSKLNQNEISNIYLVIVGNYNKDMDDVLPFEHTFLGYLTLEKIASVFQAIDVFICPSIEDSGPMMVNQSIMCGSPVVAFEMGVAIDLVITGETGYRANLKDSKDLAYGIKQILELDGIEYKKMSDNCRKLGVKLCNSIKQVEDFTKIFKEVI